jgi:hypothetical protein
VSEARVFEIEVPGEEPAKSVLARAREAARGAGIAMTGDEQRGSFRGTAEGTYEVTGRKIRISVAQKPAFVPWGMVESSLRKVFR